MKSYFRSAKRLYEKGIYQYLKSHRNLSVTGNAFNKLKEWGLLIDRVKAEQPGNVAAQGFKVYSQNDEDGIIQAIFDRIEHKSTFLEIGVQDGLECNSHYLLLKGWRGAWIEASELYCRQIADHLHLDTASTELRVIEDFANTGNVGKHYRDVCGFLGVEEIDFFSIDIDSNDLFVLRALLEAKARPSVICLEYNGKFPPPIRIGVTLDENRGWASDDYFGASLQSFHDLCVEFEYKLVTCSVIGCNAFYVRSDKAGDFPDIAIEDAWHPQRPYLSPLPAPHKATMKYLQDRLRKPA